MSTVVSNGVHREQSLEPASTVPELHELEAQVRHMDLQVKKILRCVTDKGSLQHRAYFPVRSYQYPGEDPGEPCATSPSMVRTGAASAMVSGARVEGIRADVGHPLAQQYRQFIAHVKAHTNSNVSEAHLRYLARVVFGVLSLGIP